MINKLSGNYSQPILIRILSKSSRNKISVAVVESINKNNNCDICEILKKYGIQYSLVKSSVTPELKYNYIILNFKNEDSLNNDSYYNNLIEHVLKNGVNDSKIIISFDKKKILEQVINTIITKHKATTIDYYIDHSKTSKDFYCVVNI